MTVSLTRNAKVERIVKENVAAMDAAIAHLRKHDMADVADKLGDIRDYLARAESYYRRIEATVAKAESYRDSPIKRAERIWLDMTGGKKK